MCTLFVFSAYGFFWKPFIWKCHSIWIVYELKKENTKVIIPICMGCCFTMTVDSVTSKLLTFNFSHHRSNLIWWNTCNTWCQFEACEQAGRVVGRSVRRMHKTKTEEKKKDNELNYKWSNTWFRSFVFIGKFIYTCNRSRLGWIPIKFCSKTILTFLLVLRFAIRSNGVRLYDEDAKHHAMAGENTTREKKHAHIKHKIGKTKSESIFIFTVTQRILSRSCFVHFPLFF